MSVGVIHHRRDGCSAATWGLVAAAIAALIGCAQQVRVIELAPDMEAALVGSRYVYISSMRRDGTFGTPAEIWFMYEQGAVWVASPISSWRVRRIVAGRPTVMIAVGNAGGPSFRATGSIVSNANAYAAFFRTLAEKYPQEWPTYEQRFRAGLLDGTRVLIRYQPVG